MLPAGACRWMPHSQLPKAEAQSGWSVQVMMLPAQLRAAMAVLQSSTYECLGCCLTWLTFIEAGQGKLASTAL